MSFTSVFASQRPVVYKWRYAGTLRVKEICGGTPTDQDVTSSWIKVKLGLSGDTPALAEAVATTMAERGVTVEQATEEVAKLKNLNGFKQDDKGLYMEGRHLKAALKEAISVAMGAGNIVQRGYGTTKKWITSYFPEHVFVAEDKLYLTEPVCDENGNPILDANGNIAQYQHITEPSGIHQRFVTTHNGTGIQREEYVLDAYIHFTVYTDHFFSEGEWANVWVTGENQGLGAARSQGYGTYDVTKWELIEASQTDLHVTINAAPGLAQRTAAAQAAAAKLQADLQAALAADAAAAAAAADAATTGVTVDEEFEGDHMVAHTATPSAAAAKKVPAKKAANSKAIKSVAARKGSSLSRVNS